MIANLTALQTTTMGYREVPHFWISSYSLLFLAEMIGPLSARRRECDIVRRFATVNYWWERTGATRRDRTGDLLITKNILSAPNVPIALYGRACYQQFGEAAFAQIATSDGPNRWGFGTVSAQLEFQRVGGQAWHASEQCSWVCLISKRFHRLPQIEKPTSLTCLLGNQVALHLLQTVDHISHEHSSGRAKCFAESFGGSSFHHE